MWYEPRVIIPHTAHLTTTYKLGQLKRLPCVQFRQLTEKKTPRNTSVPGRYFKCDGWTVGTEWNYYLFTANRIDQLHKALIRPGRIDIKLKFDKATTASLKKILFAWYTIHTQDGCFLQLCRNSTKHDTVDWVCLL